MKTPRFLLAAIAVGLGCFLTPARALTVREGFEITDFQNSAAAATTYVLDLGGNDFIGAIGGGDDDFFKVTVLPGRKITAIQTTGSASTPLTAPLYAGTYTFSRVSPVLPGNEPWSFTFTVAAAPDYEVMTTTNQIVVTDRSGNGDTLTVSEPFAGTIAFAAAGRTFSLNGAAFTTGSLGATSTAFSTAIVVNAGAGNDTINVGAFTGQLPSLTINGGTGDDTVNFTGSLTLVPTGNLTIDELDGSRYAMETVNVAAGAVVRVPGTSLKVQCSRNVAIEPGGSLESPTSANVTVTANQPGISTTGDFIGVRVNGGTISSADGLVSVEGRGGNAPGGSQIGVEVTNAGKIMATGASGLVNVKGTGGDSTGLLNRGVTVSGAGSEIRTIGGGLIVEGTGGPNGGYYGIGVSVLSGGVIRSTEVGSVQVYGNGAGGGGFNMGIELGAGTISAGHQFLGIYGHAGVGSDSRGVFVNNGSTIATIDIGSIDVRTDSLSIDATSSISSAPLYNVTLAHRDNLKSIDLGGADPADKLSLTDAVLDRIFTDNLVIGDTFTATIFTSAEVSPANATDVTLSTAPVQPLFSGTDVTLNGTGTLTVGGPLVIPITGPGANLGYPQLKVVGKVALTDKVLSFSTSYAGTVGEVFTLVENDGTDAIDGIFFALSEGVILPWPGSPLLKARISYVGGDGNDAVVTLVSALEVTNDSSSGPGSLRDILTYAASLPGPNIITFHPSLSGPHLNTGTVDVNDPGGVTIDASALAAGVTFTGSNDYPHFSNAAGSNLTLRRLTLTNGRSGGGGGSIVNDGTLVLEQCTLAGNRAFNGGAIFNQGTLTLVGCTLRDNTAEGAGGAIDNVGTLTLTRCTLANNSSTGATAGAIFHDEEAGLCTLNHCTFVGNSCVSASGGAITTDAALVLNYCLVAANPAGGNPAANIAGTISLTQSIVTDTTEFLAPLGDYGGPTQTIALQPGSFGRNAATASTSTSDQRGFPIVGPRDIGAYEAGTIANYAVWNYETLPATATPVERAPGFDFDGDGRTNLLEYANMTDGTVPGSSVNLALARAADGSEARLAFVLRLSATDLRYELQRSMPGIGSWVPIGDVNLRTGAVHDYGVGVTHTVNILGVEFRDPGVAGQGKAFYRLRATLLP